jgi:hypothetical protein
MCSDDGQEKIITDLVTLQKDTQRIEHLGLTLKGGQTAPQHDSAMRAAYALW